MKKDKSMMYLHELRLGVLCDKAETRLKEYGLEEPKVFALFPNDDTYSKDEAPDDVVQIIVVWVAVGEAETEERYMLFWHSKTSRFEEVKKVEEE